MTNAWRDKLVAAVLTPQVLVATLLLIGALGLAFSVPRVEAPAPPQIDLSEVTPVTIGFDARLVLVDDAMLEWQRVVRVEAPDNPPQRLAAVLDELRLALQAENQWPLGLLTPFVYLETIDRAVYAVLDIRTDAGVNAGVSVSVARERGLLRAITATVQANGVNEVRFLRDGRATDTLLGHVAVRSAL